MTSLNRACLPSETCLSTWEPPFLRLFTFPVLYPFRKSRDAQGRCFRELLGKAEVSGHVFFLPYIVRWNWTSRFEPHYIPTVTKNRNSVFIHAILEVQPNPYNTNGVERAGRKPWGPRCDSSQKTGQQDLRRRRAHFPSASSPGGWNSTVA